MISILVGNPIPGDPYKLQQWLKDLRKEYKDNKYILIWKNQKINKSATISYDHVPKFRIKDKTKKSNKSGNITINGYVFKFGEITDDDTYLDMSGRIGWGYMSHTAVICWIQHEIALKKYIDDHIEACIERGIKNTMCRFDAPKKFIEKIDHPIWTLDKLIIERHRSLLVTREIDREEKKWYVGRYKTKLNQKYFWPYSIILSKSALDNGEPDTDKRYKNFKVPKLSNHSSNSDSSDSNSSDSNSSDSDSSDSNSSDSDSSDSDSSDSDSSDSSNSDSSNSNPKKAITIRNPVIRNPVIRNPIRINPVIRNPIRINPVSRPVIKNPIKKIQL
jgi:hypothetical protein